MVFKGPWIGSIVARSMHRHRFTAHGDESSTVPQRTRRRRRATGLQPASRARAIGRRRLHTARGAANGDDQSSDLLEHANRLWQRGGRTRDGGIAIAQVDGDVRVEDVGHLQAVARWELLDVTCLNRRRRGECTQPRSHLGNRRRRAIHRQHVTGTDDD